MTLQAMPATASSAADTALRRSDADPAADGSPATASHPGGHRQLEDCRMTRTDFSPAVLAHLCQASVLAVLPVVDILVAEVLARGGAEVEFEELVLSELRTAAARAPLLSEETGPGDAEQSVLPSKSTVLVSARTTCNETVPTFV